MLLNQNIIKNIIKLFLCLVKHYLNTWKAICTHTWTPTLLIGRSVDRSLYLLETTVKKACSSSVVPLFTLLTSACFYNKNKNKY